MAKKIIVLVALLAVVVGLVVVLRPNAGPGEDVQGGGLSEEDRAALAAASNNTASAGTPSSTNAVAAATGTNAAGAATNGAPVAGAPRSFVLSAETDVSFHGYSNIKKQHCWFLFVDGTFDMPAGTPAGGKLEVEVDTAEVECEDTSFPKVLKSKFLDADNFPDASFTSQVITHKEGDLHRVVGELTIKDNTEQVAFDATITATDEGVTLTAEVKLDRADFDLNYNGIGNYAISDEFSLDLTLEGEPK